MTADAGVPTLYDVCTVHISVTDVNDNRPVFLSQHGDNETTAIHLTSPVHVGHVITQVTANDADSGVNAPLSYSLVSGQNAQRLFDIDKKTGQLTVTAPLHHSATYDLVVAASDAGTPSLTSHKTLHIVVSNDGASEDRDVDVVSRRSAQSQTSSSVMEVTWWFVAGGLITAGLVVLTCVTLCLLIGVNKRRRKIVRRRQPRTATPPRTASLSQHGTQRPAAAPLALMTDMDSLTSTVLARRHFDDELAAGTMTTALYVPTTADCKSAPLVSVRSVLLLYRVSQKSKTS